MTSAGVLQSVMYAFQNVLERLHQLVGVLDGEWHRGPDFQDIIRRPRPAHEDPLCTHAVDDLTGHLRRGRTG